ncbi:MAG: PAS domain-containing protein [Myxococcaceae bacterium]
MSHPALFAIVPDVACPPFVAEPGVDDPLCDFLFNQSPLGVGVVEWLGDDIRYLAVNPSTAARLGRSVEEIRGRRASELGVPPAAFPALSSLAAEAMQRGAATRRDWEVATLQGLRCFRTTVLPLATPAGRPPRFAYVTEELTRLRELEQRLGGPEGTKSLATDVEQPLADALGVLDMVGDEVETLVAIHPELELEDAADGLRDARRQTRRAHQNLRHLLWG